MQVLQLQVPKVSKPSKYYLFGILGGALFPGQGFQVDVSRPSLPNLPGAVRNVMLTIFEALHQSGEWKPNRPDAWTVDAGKSELSGVEVLATFQA